MTLGLLELVFLKIRWETAEGITDPSSTQPSCHMATQNKDVPCSAVNHAPSPKLTVLSANKVNNKERSAHTHEETFMGGT